jgi:hypothetical protein
VSNGLEAWAQVLATPDLRGEEAMMNHARLIVVLFLLASAGTAFAECAWVLWVNEWFDASLDRAPSDVQAFATRSDCLAAMEQTAQTFKETMGSEAGIFAASPTPSTRAGRRGSDGDPELHP